MSRPAAPAALLPTWRRTGASPGPSAPLGDRLHHDWARLSREPDALRRAAGWALLGGTIDDLDQVLAAVGYEVAATDDTESAMRRLVLLARTDDLAARVVLQRLLPGLLATVRRRRSRSDDALDELVGAAWIAITTFGPGRRPRCIAAALISDADYLAFRRPWRRASAGEMPTDLAFDEIAHPATITARDELAELFTIASQSGVPLADLALLRRLLDTDRAHEVASALGVTTRTVRNRRARITGRLRELALAG